jgi:ABC-type branched-subunit amino acid transport system permease subunit
MAAPRFRLRSLVLLIVFLALALAIATLSVQNHRLKVENARLQSAQSKLGRLVFLDSLDMAFPVVLGARQMVPLSAVTREAHPFLDTVNLDTMPDGPEAFAK